MKCFFYIWWTYRVK